MTPTVQLGTRTIPRIGLGTNRLRRTAANVAFIRGAVEAGVRMIDTAHLYTEGESEHTIGDAHVGETDDCVIATKGGYGGPGQGRPDILHKQIEESLSRLKRPRITLYYLHRVDPTTPIEDSLGAIKEHVDAGQIEHVGISEVTVDQIERAQRVLPIAAVQNDYSMAERKHDEVVDYCEKAGIIFVPFFPLRGSETPKVQSVAEKHGATAKQVALAWLLSRSPSVLAIPGSLSVAHVKENLGALAIELDDQDLAALK